METVQKSIEENGKRLICSEKFDDALAEGVTRLNEIEGSLKSRNKDNYSLFYDLMLKSRTDVQSALYRRKRERTAEESELVKRFAAETKSQYKFVKDMVFVPEAESMDENGLPNRLPKKLVQLVERISAVAALLKYIGHGEFEDELGKRGIGLVYKTLEEQSPAFENEHVKEDVKGVFDAVCGIQKEIDRKRTEISEEVFECSVPQELRYDKDACPCGIKPSDFGKLVAVKAKIEKAKTDESMAKAVGTANTMSEEKTFDIARSEILRAKYMDLSEPK